MPIRTGVRRVAAVAAFAVALTLGVAGCSGSSIPASLATLAPDRQLPDDTQQQLETAVTDAMTAVGASGAIVGVWVPWSGSWVTGLGTVSADSKTTVSADMTFRAGSITRAMTCDVLYELVDDGTVKLGDAVTDYVSGLPKYTNVTLETLCNGTSGIGSYNAILGPQSLTNPAREWDPRELVGYGIGQVDGEVEPGVAFRDSDAGYLLLGLALERASGKSAQELFADRIFDPLDLAHTALPGDASAAPTVGSSTALPGFYLGSKTKSGDYVCDEPTEITAQSASYGFTDSGIVTDIRDLGVYAKALASQALVKSTTRFADGMPLSATSPSWFTTTGGVVEAGPLIGQYGSTRGYLTAAFSDPDSGLTVAVVLNNSAAGRGPIVDLARQLAAIAAGASATGDETAVAVGLPWTAEQYQKTIAAAAICTAAKK